MSFQYFCSILVSTDDERRRRLQEIHSKWPSKIRLDSKTNLAVLDNSSCCITTWSPDIESWFRYALCFRENREGSGEGMAQGSRRQILELMAPVINPEYSVRQAVNKPPFNDKEDCPLVLSKYALEQIDLLTNPPDRESDRMKASQGSLIGDPMALM